MALVAVEGALQLTAVGAGRLDPWRTGGLPGGHAFTEAHPDLLLRLAPGVEVLGTYRLNDRGWRGPAVPPTVPPGTRRVVCLGDSCTFGVGVRQQDTWPAQLEAMLGVLLDGEVSVSVVNAGVPGYSTWQNRVQLETDVLELRPDVVVLMPVGHNDAALTPELPDAEAARSNHGASAWLGRLRLVTLVRAAFAPGATDDRDVRAAGTRVRRDDLVRRVSRESFRENLHEVITRLAEAGVATVLVDPPHAESRRRRRPGYDQASADTRAVGAARGVPLARAREAVAAREPLSPFVDGLHPDPDGHRVVALAVLEALLEADALLDDGPRRRFLAAWLAARREGLLRHDAGAHLDGAPPGFGDWLAAASDPGLGERIAAADPDLPVPVADLDPLWGRRASPYHAEALRLRAAAAADQDTRRGLNRRANDVDRVAVPPDVFGVLLRDASGGDAARASPGHLALARACVVLERRAGAWIEPGDRRLHGARLRAARGAPGQALDLVDAVLRLAPGQLEAHAERLVLLRRLGRTEDARACADALEVLDPGAAAVHVHRGLSALARGDGPEAVASFERALLREPADGEARLGLARALGLAGDLVGARQALAWSRALLGAVPAVSAVEVELEERAAAASAR